MRVWLTVGGLAAFVIAGFATIWWFFAISLGEQQLARAEKRLSERGYDLHYARLEQSGFPLRLEWVIHGVTLTQSAKGTASHEIKGVADRLRVQAKPWAPQRLRFDVEGKHQWTIQTQGAAGQVAANIGSASGSVGPRDEASGWQFSTYLTGIEARSETAGEGSLSIAELALSGQLPLAMDALAVQMDLTAVRLPRDTGFGSVLQSASLKSDLKPLPRGIDATGLRLWQTDGGLLTIDDFRIEFGALQGSAKGAIGLDSDLRGQGNITIRMREPQRLVAAAANAGWINAKQKPLVALGLGLFSGRSNGGQAEVALPFDLKSGGLWLGPLKLTDLPPVSN